MEPRTSLYIMWVLTAVWLLIGCASDYSSRDTLAKISIEKISRKDWRGLYNMASEEEKAEMGIDQEQFHRVCEIVCEGFPSELGARQRNVFKNSETSYEYTFLMDNLPMKAPDMKVRLPKELLSVGMRKVKGKWYPLVSYTPLMLIPYRQEVKELRRVRLLRAMESANVPYLISFESNRKLRIEDQRLVVQGKLDQAAAFRP